ncbi:UDP-N-acetylmuramoyl-L-alanine--D-glutamate ligase [Stigmatella aurantiaca]|uniref:UDP-N-acetylmuramoylalanine--D-glutamate ligase n=1 Tax=Stigmatella aurantiaca (strain DW4/3-1) TaxID=378806 RepID=Q09BM1_STIAD|nr:UDP-N-acetylmuramoyl-L-alanine--D-glutamate ligase [Stigmatella aurantiaca]ADO74021.1 UDP-N-acetylmuramoylalanine--D-glutamate ligase [Stigmatella aurantiaca DW4/3-1]EAU69133.1 UDP-N-acetylmuramoylalanine--D-glutamate ligase [Stigmatella aurantiaca DW4/3-1]
MEPSLSGQKVLVFGLAKSGVAAIRLLLAHGARVTALDERDEAALGAVAVDLKAQGVPLVHGPVPPGLLESQALVVVSPGVPLSRPEFKAARAAGVPIWGEVELASRFLSAVPLFGITGTNGKSTTTALTGELFSRGGGRTFVGGNLGRPFSEAALTPEAWDALVVELSSFQLEGIQQMRARGAAILNLTPDHIDRYESHAAYGQAKTRIFLNQGVGDFAVVNVDDPDVVGLARQARVPRYGFSLTGNPVEALELAGRAVAQEGGFRLDFLKETYSLTNRALRGAHNAQNAMAATLLARLGGVPREAVQAGLDGYPGLPHRLESVRVLDGVEWVNDSKATNVDSVLVALRAFAGNLLLIAGGKGKGAPYQPMVDEGRGKVKAVLTIGQDAELLAAAYREAAPVHACGTLEVAVRRARELAKGGDTVLLSPACASYDQFKNFEDRGETFKRLVKAL